MGLLYVKHGARSWAPSVGTWSLQKLVRALMMFCRIKGDYQNTRAELGQGGFIRNPFRVPSAIPVWLSEILSQSSWVGGRRNWMKSLWAWNQQSWLLREASQKSPWIYFTSIAQLCLPWTPSSEGQAKADEACKKNQNSDIRKTSSISSDSKLRDPAHFPEPQFLSCDMGILHFLIRCLKKKWCTNIATHSKQVTLEAD